MIPAQFDYVAPSTLDEALSLLAEHTDDAKILAGGHSLIPAMKLRLAQPARTGQSYMKVHPPASGFAVVGVAVTLTLGGDGKCSSVGVGVTGVATRVYRAAQVESALAGATADEQTIADAASHAADGVDANGDIYASADYRRHLAAVYTRRAIAAAASKIK